jgi:hypothetical protein
MCFSRISETCEKNFTVQRMFHMCFSRIAKTCEIFCTVQFFFSYVSVLSKRGKIMSPILEHNVWWMALRYIPLPVKKDFSVWPWYRHSGQTVIVAPEVPCEHFGKPSQHALILHIVAWRFSSIMFFFVFFRFINRTTIQF